MGGLPSYPGAGVKDALPGPGGHQVAHELARLVLHLEPAHLEGLKGGDPALEAVEGEAVRAILTGGDLGDFAFEIDEELFPGETQGVYPHH